MYIIQTPTSPLNKDPPRHRDTLQLARKKKKKKHNIITNEKKEEKKS